MVSLEFFIDIKSLRSHYVPGVDSASDRNEYQEHFLGVKCGRCIKLTNLPPYRAIVTSSGNLNFLEPSGHLRHVMGLLDVRWWLLLLIFIYLFLRSVYNHFIIVSIKNYCEIMNAVSFKFVSIYLRSLLGRMTSWSQPDPAEIFCGPDKTLLSYVRDIVFWCLWLASMQQNCWLCENRGWIFSGNHKTLPSVCTALQNAAVLRPELHIAVFKPRKKELRRRNGEGKKLIEAWVIWRSFFNCTLGY